MVSFNIQGQKPVGSTMEDAVPLPVKDGDSKQKAICTQKIKNITIITLLVLLLLQFCACIVIFLTFSQTCMNDVKENLQKIECYFEGCSEANKTNKTHAFTEHQSTTVKTISVGPKGENINVVANKTSTNEVSTEVKSISATKTILLGNDGHDHIKPCSAHPTSNYRMVKHANPIHYKIEISNFITKGKFNGKVTIDVKVTHKRNYFVLHVGSLLTIINVIVKKPNGDNLNITDWSTKNRNEFLQINLDTYLEKGDQYIIQISYTGQYSDTLNGVYRSFYYVNSQSKFVVSTHFEPTYARTLFPCYDEPKYKATFDFSIEEDKAYTVLFNTPLKKTETVSTTRVKHTFQTTPKMSSYLLAFMVCQYESLSAKTKSGILVKTHAPKHLLQKTKQALQYAVKSLEFLESYLNHTYRLPKLDLAYAPDFGVAGMENWGLIFLNGYIMFGTEKSWSGQSMRIASVVFHEVAHQWFGNLVTAQWWSDLWLHEGFATYFAYLAAEEIESKWNTFDYFTLTMQSAMRYDDRNTTKKLSGKIRTRREVKKSFNSIAYSKGAAVLRMYHEAVGPQDMQIALRKYITTHKEKSVETQHFTDTIKDLLEKSDKKGLLKEWTTVDSYPIVHVTLVKKTKLKFRQEKYISRQQDQKWTIPIECTTNEGEYIEFVFKDKETTINLKKPADWIKCNKDHKGYYRVNYDENTWDKLSLLTHPNPYISKSDLANLIDDSYKLAFNLEIPITIPLNFMLSISKVRSLPVWISAVNNYYRLWRYFQFHEPTYDDLRMFGKIFTADLFYDINSLNKNEDEKMLKRFIFLFATDLEFYPAIEEAMDIFDHWLYGYGISEDYRQVAVINGIKWGKRCAYFETFSKYLASTDEVERRELLIGLASSRDEGLLYKLLKYTREAGIIMKQNVALVYKSVAKTFTGRRILFKFIIDTIIEKFARADEGDDDIITSDLFDALAEYDMSEAEVSQMKEVLKSSSLGESEESSLIQEFMESLQNKLDLGESTQQEISELVSKLSMSSELQAEKMMTVENKLVSMIRSLV